MQTLVAGLTPPVQAKAVGLPRTASRAPEVAAPAQVAAGVVAAKCLVSELWYSMAAQGDFGQGKWQHRKLQASQANTKMSHGML